VVRSRLKALLQSLLPGTFVPDVFAAYAAPTTGRGIFVNPVATSVAPTFKQSRLKPLLHSRSCNAPADEGMANTDDGAARAIASARLGVVGVELRP
jgi:hypothetical protein